MNSRYVITGGPGAGKTTLLDALNMKGFRCVPESARHIIKQRIIEGLPPRPEPKAFAGSILSLDLAKHEKMKINDKPIFYDRGILDALYMLDLIGGMARLEINRYVKNYPYNRTVFLLPPWQEIYQTDSERDQNFDEAVTVFEGMRSWYLKLGYKTVEVPKLPVAERLAFVLGETSEQ